MSVEKISIAESLEKLLNQVISEKMVLLSELDQKFTKAIRISLGNNLALDEEVDLSMKGLELLSTIKKRLVYNADKKTTSAEKLAIKFYETFEATQKTSDVYYPFLHLIKRDASTVNLEIIGKATKEKLKQIVKLKNFSEIVPVIDETDLTDTRLNVILEY